MLRIDVFPYPFMLQAGVEFRDACTYISIHFFKMLVLLGGLIHGGGRGVALSTSMRWLRAWHRDKAQANFQLSRSS